MVFLVGGKFNFNVTKEKATGEIETDGILGKILKIKQLDQNNELKRDLIKTSEDDLDRLTHAQQQLQRAVETLEIEMPEEFLMDNDNKIGRTKDEIPVKKQESN